VAAKVHIPEQLQLADQAAAAHQVVQVEQQQEQQELQDKAAPAVQVQVAELILAAVAAAEQQQSVEMVPQELPEQVAQEVVHIHHGAQQHHQDKI
jgi:hypothetical protein